MNTLKITRCGVCVIFADNERVKNSVFSNDPPYLGTFGTFRGHFYGSSLCTYIKKSLKKGLITSQTSQTHFFGRKQLKSADLKFYANIACFLCAYFCGLIKR